eukprot:TRINITY_DN1308_c0_g1_i7.p1 TRINITY_DN1308_c0_g1~~TRINITY_DN1308_c0_g1_i7.p1  ORF type:complete len:318 (-),score=42.80 TRINITY_DN1308_c0_g1_i7:24-950(-)
MPGKEKAGSKKAKDPNAPKRPLTAFFHFLAAKREAYVKDHPANKLGDVAKGLSEVWRGLSEAQKKPFEDLAAASKKTYEREMAHYTPAPRDPEDEDDDGKPSKKKAKKEKDPDAPKRALSAYMLFSIAEGPRIRSAHTGDPKDDDEQDRRGMEECGQGDEGQVREESGGGQEAVHQGERRVQAKRRQGQGRRWRGGRGGFRGVGPAPRAAAARWTLSDPNVNRNAGRGLLLVLLSTALDPPPGRPPNGAPPVCAAYRCLPPSGTASPLLTQPDSGPQVAHSAVAPHRSPPPVLFPSCPRPVRGRRSLG